MLTNDLVPCFVQSFKTDSKTGYEKALLVSLTARARISSVLGELVPGA